MLPAEARSAAASLPLDRFVVDNRFSEAMQIGAHAARGGVPLSEFSGDLTQLWYEHLDLEWKKHPKALAGVTTRQGLFVLETLAADHRMRVVYRGEHAAPRDGRVSHLLCGPEALIASAAAPSTDASNWHRLLGSALTRCPLGAPQRSSVSLSTAADRSSPAKRRSSPGSSLRAPRSH